MRSATVSEVVGAFLRCEGGEEPTDRCGEVLGGACGGFAQEVFELGKDLLDRVEVGRVFRQEQQFGAGRADEPAHGFAFVAAEIVHDDDVARLQGGEENLLDIGLKGRAVDRTVEQPWRVDSVVAKRRQEGGGFPMAVRDLGGEPHAARRPSP